MEIEYIDEEIRFENELNLLDEFELDFVYILERHNVEYLSCQDTWPFRRYLDVP